MTDDLQALLSEIRQIVSRIRAGGDTDRRTLEHLAQLLDELLERYDLNGNGSTDAPKG